MPVLKKPFSLTRKVQQNLKGALLTTNGTEKYCICHKQFTFVQANFVIDFLHRFLQLMLCMCMQWIPG